MAKWGVDMRPSKRPHPLPTASIWDMSEVSKFTTQFLFSRGPTSTRNWKGRQNHHARPKPGGDRSGKTYYTRREPQSGISETAAPLGEETNAGRKKRKWRRNRRGTAGGDAEGQPETDQNHIPSHEANSNIEFDPSPTDGPSAAPSDHGGARDFLRK